MKSLADKAYELSIKYDLTAEARLIEQEEKMVNITIFDILKFMIYLVS